MSPRVLCRVIVLCICAGHVPAAAQRDSAQATIVFRRFSEYVGKIEVTETGSGAKATLGSGFFVSSDGHMITNYHVISKLVHDPDRYRAELIGVDGTEHRVSIISVDAISDLALVRTPFKPKAHFSLAPVSLEQGTRLYALGHPRDLGLSIVEGTYNGLLRHTLYPKIHFTGSLNPGMSGGPTISERGDVVGINVSTEGNEISFLVPAERAAELLAKARQSNFVSSQSLLVEVGRQIRAFQDIYFARMFTGATPRVKLGKFDLPTKPAPFFKCWGDGTRNNKLAYQVVEHSCSTDDYLFISGDQLSGVAELSYELITTSELNPARFYALYSSRFEGETRSGMYGSLDEVTPFECETRNVVNRARKLRAAMCVRRYRKLEGLFDAVISAAILGERDTGLLTTLSISGVSFENAQRLARRFLESIK
ncbi:MAG: trypsin-like peptidase domain-containing protein [Anaerolineae bacterium]|nr:trypsin-like peptidase domain-containing protein [Gemmatimonadaceae bacterium]